MNGDRIPKKNRYIAAGLHFLFLICRISYPIEYRFLYLLNSEIIVSTILAIFQIIRITPIIGSIVCLTLYKESSFVTVAVKDATNCFLNQLIISLFIGLILTYVAIVFNPNKHLTGSHILYVFDAAMIAWNALNIVHAIYSIIAIIFTLSGKRFKNRLIIHFIGSN